MDFTVDQAQRRDSRFTHDDRISEDAALKTQRGHEYGGLEVENPNDVCMAETQSDRLASCHVVREDRPKIGGVHTLVACIAKVEVIPRRAPDVREAVHARDLSTH